MKRVLPDVPSRAPGDSRPGDGTLAFAFSLLWPVLAATAFASVVSVLIEAFVRVG